MIRLKNESNIEVSSKDFLLLKNGHLDKSMYEIIYGNSKAPQSEQTFYEQESKYIDFDDAHAVSFDVIEKVPTYPGCNGDNAALKECMSDKISKYVNRNFNVNLGKELGLTGVNRIFLSFVIDTNGDVINVRSRAPYPELETEAKRVINGLPKMVAGEQNGQLVDVLYALPITLKIAE